MSGTARKPKYSRNNELAGALDHVAVVSAFPDRLFNAYELMGFTLSPIARHSGSVKPGMPAEVWGIGNRCAMFPDGGYLELLAVFDSTLYCRGFPERLDQYEGLHIVAFECPDAEKTSKSLHARGIEVLGVGRLERPIDTPTGTQTAKFSLVRIDPTLTPECHFNILQHHTPEHLWQPSLTVHANGARQLISVTVCASDPEASSVRFQALLNAVPEKVDGIHRLSMHSGTVYFVSPEQLPEIDYDAPPPSVPFVASFSVLTSDLSQVQTVLETNNVPHKLLENSISVLPEMAMGALVSFTDIVP